MMFGVLPTVQSPPPQDLQLATCKRSPSLKPSSMPVQPVTTPAQTIRVDSGRLNTTTFVALGEGLAAGMGNFTLFADTQRESFPAQMARQMQVQFTQPLMQAPGIGNTVGFDHLPVVVPAFLQTTVLDEILPPPAPILLCPVSRWMTRSISGRRSPWFTAMMRHRRQPI